MHKHGWFAVALATAMSASAADKGPPTATGNNEKVTLNATLIQDKEAIAREVGSDLGGNFILVRVQLTPKGEAIAVSRDDFTLRSHKDGQKSGAFHPSQIAGRGSLVVTSRGGGVMMAQDKGTVWGGGPGGPGGPPMRLPGPGGEMGSPTAGVSEAKAVINDGGKTKEDPVLAVLKAKVLEEKETKDAVSGLLYFSLEGKHKAKQLSLMYSGPGGRLILEFR